MSLPERINFFKILLPKKDEEDKEETSAESNNIKALKFLNALEFVMSKRHFDGRFFAHFFKVREFLRMPGSSVKILMESVALITPNML